MALRRNDLWTGWDPSASRMIFRASHDEGKHLFLSRLGMIGFRNLIRIWFGRVWVYVDFYWFDGFDLFTNWLIASLAAKSPCWIQYLPIFPKNMTSTHIKHEKIYKTCPNQTTLCDKNNQLDNLHQKATALEQKITFRIPFGLHPTRSAGKAEHICCGLVRLGFFPADCEDRFHPVTSMISQPAQKPLSFES